MLYYCVCIVQGRPWFNLKYLVLTDAKDQTLLIQRNSIEHLKTYRGSRQPLCHAWTENPRKLAVISASPLTRARTVGWCHHLQISITCEHMHVIHRWMQISRTLSTLYSAAPVHSHPESLLIATLHTLCHSLLR